MLYPCFLRSIGQRLANSNLIAPGESVDESLVGTHEKIGYESFIFQGALDDGDVLEGVELFRNGVILLGLTDVCSYLIANGRGDPTDRGSLSTRGIDGHEHFLWHVSCRWHSMSLNTVARRDVLNQC